MKKTNNINIDNNIILNIFKNNIIDNNSNNKFRARAK